MRDLETNSLWSHIVGKAMRGALKGRRLKLLPSVMATWSEWKLRHPETTLLGMSRTSRAYKGALWKQPGRYVYGLHFPSGHSPAVPLKRLQENPVFNFELAGSVGLITSGARGAGASSFDRIVKGQTLVFSIVGKGIMTDDRTSSLWDTRTGKCFEGPMKGEILRVIPGMISFRSAWEVFFPEGKLLE